MDIIRFVIGMVFALLGILASIRPDLYAKLLLMGRAGTDPTKQMLLIYRISGIVLLIIGASMIYKALL